MHTNVNVLPAAFITVATYALIALCKSVVPGFARLPNNALRAVGFVLCYGMLIVNALVAGAVHWADLWGLLPVAGALFSTAALMYHIGTDGPPAPTTHAWGHTTVSYGPPLSVPTPVAPVGPSVTDPEEPPTP